MPRFGVLGVAGAAALMLACATRPPAGALELARYQDFAAAKAAAAERGGLVLVDFYTDW